MDTTELDSLYLSKRILVDTDECKDFVSGGVLVSNIDGTIRRIFTSQQEINSWMFKSHGAEVKLREEKQIYIFCFSRESREEIFVSFYSLFMCVGSRLWQFFDYERAY